MSLSDQSQSKRKLPLLPTELGQMILSLVDHESLATIHAPYATWGKEASFSRPEFFAKPCEIWPYDHHETSLHDPKWYRVVQSRPSSSSARARVKQLVGTGKVLQECEPTDEGAFTLNPLLSSSDDCPGIDLLRSYPRTLQEVHRDTTCTGSKNPIMLQAFPNLTLFTRLLWDDRGHVYGCPSQRIRFGPPTKPARATYFLDVGSDPDMSPTSASDHSSRRSDRVAKILRGPKMARALPQRKIKAVMIDLAVTDLMEGMEELQDSRPTENNILTHCAEHVGINFLSEGTKKKMFHDTHAMRSFVYRLLSSTQRTKREMTVAGVDVFLHKIKEFGSAYDAEDFQATRLEISALNNNSENLRILDDGQSLDTANSVFDLTGYCVPKFD